MEVYSNGTQYIIFIVSAISVKSRNFHNRICTFEAFTNQLTLFFAVGVGFGLHLFAVIFQSTNDFELSIFGASFWQNGACYGQCYVCIQEHVLHTAGRVCACISAESR